LPAVLVRTTSPERLRIPHSECTQPVKSASAATPRYALWHHNDWIGVPGDTGARASGAP